MSHVTNTYDFLRVFSTGRETQAGSAVLGLLTALLSSFGFPLFAASAREALLLPTIVLTRFQFVVLTGATLEVKDFLHVSACHNYRPLLSLGEGLNIIVNSIGALGVSLSPRGCISRWEGSTIPRPSEADGYGPSTSRFANLSADTKAFAAVKSLLLAFFNVSTVIPGQLRLYSTTLNSLTLHPAPGDTVRPDALRSNFHPLHQCCRVQTIVPVALRDFNLPPRASAICAARSNASGSSRYANTSTFSPAKGRNASIILRLSSSVRVLHDNAFSSFTRAKRSASAFSFASAMREFASLARASASAICFRAVSASSFNPAMRKSASLTRALARAISLPTSFRLPCSLRFSPRNVSVRLSSAETRSFDCWRICRSMLSAFRLNWTSMPTPTNTTNAAINSSGLLNLRPSDTKAMTATSAISPPISASLPMSRQNWYPTKLLSNGFIIGCDLRCVPGLVPPRSRARRCNLSCPQT
jgi:hypothetical protein